MMPICIIPFAMPCMSCLLHCISIWSMFALLNLFLHFSKVCTGMLTACCRNLFCLYLLTVTPFGVCLICNLISFSCTLCLCYCLLLLNNPKYGLGQNSTKSFNCRAALSVMPCLGRASLKLTRIDSLLCAPPLDMFVCYAMLAWVPCHVNNRWLITCS